MEGSVERGGGVGGLGGSVEGAGGGVDMAGVGVEGVDVDGMGVDVESGLVAGGRRYGGWSYSRCYLGSREGTSGGFVPSIKSRRDNYYPYYPYYYR